MDFFVDVIKAKKNIANKVDLANSMNIAFGIDESFVIGMGVLMVSIIENNPSSAIAFHVFTDRLRSEDINRLAILGQKYKKVAVCIYYINDDKFKDFPTSFIWSKATYYRFIVCKELSGVTNRCLYLDSDILCLGSLEKLFKMSFKYKTALVVSDYDTMLDYARANIGFDGEQYFNAGFMMIDIKRWNRSKISEQAIEILMENGDFKFHDQDVLNLLLNNKAVFLSRCYNTIYHLADMKEKITDDTVFIHYSGSAKPWQRWGQFHFLTPLWLKYQKDSPFAGVPIQEPQTYKQAKFMARTMKRTGNNSEWLHWLSLYGAWKLRDKIKKLTEKV